MTDKGTLIHSTLHVMARYAWHDVTLKDIALNCELSHDKILAHISSPQEIIDLIHEEITSALSAESEILNDPSLSDHEQYFEAIFLCLETLQPYKNALRQATHRHPQLGLQLSFRLQKALYKALNIHLQDFTKVIMLKGVLLTTLSTWLRENDPQLPKTMQALDQNLSKAIDIKSGNIQHIIPSPSRILTCIGERLSAR